MIQNSDDAAVPVDYVMVEFPAGSSDFDHETAREVLALMSAEVIRVLDGLVLAKDDRGAIEAVELGETGSRGSLAVIEGQLATVLAEDDIADLAHAMTNGTTACVLVCENTWCNALLEAAHASGARVISSGRITPPAIVDSTPEGAGDRSSAVVGVRGGT